MNIFFAEENDALQIAKIHQEEIKKGFLSSLKVIFLCKFYEAIINSRCGICIIIKKDNEIIGFITGVTDINIFYKYFFKNYFFSLISIILLRAFNFSVISKVIEIIFYPKKTKDLPKAELISFAVKNKFQSQGLGTQLLQKFIIEMKNRQINIFKVLVGKKLRAVSFYKKNGFSELRLINVHNNQQSIIFIYKII